MSDSWKRWEGRSAGGFPLLRYIGGSVRSAIFLTERHEGESVVGAAIKLVPIPPQAAPQDDQLQLLRWRQAAELSHPHLIRLYEMARCEVSGAPVLYLVMECAEENLAQVLPERALTPEEARAMLGTVLDVLSYLHGKGFVHGQIRPSNIMAIGDQLKVSSDGLRRAGESVVGAEYHGVYDPPENALGIIPVTERTSPAGDVWSLGVTLVVTLTGNAPAAPTAGQQSPVPQTLPQPFLDIANHCLLLAPQSRWTVAQIAERLEGRAPVRAARAPDAQRPNAQASKPAARRSGSAGLIAGGFALLLGVILAWSMIARRHSGAGQVPAAAASEDSVRPEPSSGVTSLREGATRAPAPSVGSAPSVPGGLSVRNEDRSSKALASKPASIQSEAIPGEKAGPREKLPEGEVIRGEVAQQVMPEVLQSARDTIRGTLKVSVKVNVDQSGKVEDAEFESAGPSKYFAGAALKAAQSWKFKPPQAGGQGVLSRWILQFEFTSDGTRVVSTQTMP